jgi:heavy metal translocating P-type ATPase
LDLIAALSMAGSLYLGEYLAGNVIAMMFAGGQVLETYAHSRARQEMKALLTRTPRHATRYEGESLVTVAIDTVKIGDHLLIRPGDVLPVDGILSKVSALLDESVMTGEAAPVSHAIGDRLVSGTTNIGGAFDLAATTDAKGSTFAAIVRLVETAEQQKAPMARLADQYALGFFGYTLLLAGAAWILSGDPIRALAVFVVATPCPLILAVPVAIVAGISRCATIGVIIKNGGALEALAATRSILFDKTGTITAGHPVVKEISQAPPWTTETLLAVAGSLSQGSTHSVSKAIVRQADDMGLAMQVPAQVVEIPGEGVSGFVAGKEVYVGTFAYVSGHVSLDGWFSSAEALVAAGSGLMTAVGIDGKMDGILTFEDVVRPEAKAVLMALRAGGIKRLGLLTGDRLIVATTIAIGLSFDHIEADATPAGKVEAVLREKRLGVVAMVGDGVNDAPALASADVGIALGAKGAGASAESADVVVLVDGLQPLPAAFNIAKRTFAIARQSVGAGIGLSAIGMILAALGVLLPIEGAIAQEIIDVAVILNALRALGGKTIVTISH